MIQPVDYEHVKSLLLDIQEQEGEYILSEHLGKMHTEEMVIVILSTLCGLITTDQASTVADPLAVRIGLTDKGEQWLYLYEELCKQ